MAPKVFIATPAFGGQVAIQYVVSLLGTLAALNAADVGCIVSLVHGRPYVESERNWAVHRFLTSDCTHLLFIDADLEFDHGAALRLLQRDEDIAVGMYPYKEHPETYPCRINSREDGTPEVLPNGLIDCDGGPTGFMMIRRDVLEKMIQHYPELGYEEKGTYLFALFECTLDNGKFWGEDYWFCKRWIAMGGKTYVDPDISFSHIGNYAWKGNFHEYLLRQPGGSKA